MDQNQVRQVITAQFYQSLTASGVQVQSLSQDELQGIVNALADGVFAAMAALQDEAFDGHAQPTARGATPNEPVVEVNLWRGRPFLTIGVIYELTSQRLRIIRGIFGNVIEEIELVRVKDTNVKQHAGERMLDVGDITVISTDSSTPEKVLHNVSDPLTVREMIRKATIEEKERRGLLYREELN